MHSHALIFIQDLAIIMLMAGMATVLCHRFKQPIVLGYILAGVVIGPHTPPFLLISDEITIRTLAELGVIFLMFSLGLEFNLHKLRKVGGTAVITAIIEIIFMMWLGYLLGGLFGWTKINSIFLGAILSISSTTIIVKALNELGIKKEGFAQIIFGILIIEDIFAILILALLSSLAISGTLHFSELIYTTAKLTSFLIVSMVVGLLLIPRLLAYIAKFKNDEVLLIAVLGICFGFCLLVVKLNYSVALGAFIVGAIIAESKHLTKIEFLVNPVRDMFSAIFFVSVGLLFNPEILATYFIPITIITLVVIIGKVLSCTVGGLVTGHDGRTSMRVGMGLAQIGEFSFIIASLGITLNVTDQFLYSIAVCVSVITALTTPYFIRHSDSVTRYIKRWLPKGISSTFHVYTDWLQSIHPTEDQLKLQLAVKRSIIQVIINLFIVIAIFIFSTYVAHSGFGSSLIKITNIYLQKGIIWATALILSLPFLVAAYRKIKALSMILAEFSMSKSADERLSFKIRGIIAEVIPILAFFSIMILIFLLSANILPPIELLFLILALVSVLIAYLLPWLIKMHSQLQVSLIESIKGSGTKKKSDK